MYTEPTGPHASRITATASLSRTQNFQGEGLSNSAEIHCAPGSALDQDAYERVRLTEGVFDAEMVGTAVRIEFDRHLAAEEALQLLKHCMSLLGCELAPGDSVVEWSVKQQTH